MKKLTTLGLILLFFSNFSSFAAESLKVRRITIEGQKKIEVDAIAARIQSKEGQNYSADQVAKDVESLFKSGYFNNIEVYRETSGAAVDLIYRVQEKPSIAEIFFEGNSELKDEDLTSAIGIKTFEIVNLGKLREAQEKLQKMYEDKGYFLAKVDLKIEDVKKDETVKLTFIIEENDKVKVKKIRFLGNKRLKDNYLKSKLLTEEGGFFSFMSGTGAYKQDVFDRDTQMLRYLYFNEGYVQVKIDRPQVSVTPDKKGIFITIRIEEGEQFNVGEVDFAGDILFGREELLESINIDTANVFAYEVLQKDLSDLQAKYGDLGYAFANVIPRTRINEQERKVDVVFEFDKGNKVYFGSITVIGNSKTRDKVVRRELKVREGELYNETRKRESIENVQRLGYFDEVNFKTSTSPEKPDILNIDIFVKERNTGSIQLGAGYGSSTGVTFNGQVNQSNFLGKGQRLGVSLNFNSEGNFYNLNFTEPYFRDTLWSVGFDAYQSQNSRSDYTEHVKGGAFRVGHPLGEYLSGFIRYKYDYTNLKPIYEKDVLLTDYSLFPLNDYDGVTSSVTFSLEYDKRNDRFSPSKGVFVSGSMEYAGLGGDLKYIKGTTSVRYFKKIFWDVVWRHNLTYGLLNSQDGRPVPFTETYLLGGPYSLRGFRFYKVGKRKFSQQRYDYWISKNLSPDLANKLAERPFGGRQQLFYSMEFEFPLIAEAGIKGVTFYDIGQAEDEIKSSDFYSDVGLGFRWFSPIGPLRFEWGFPLARDPNYHDPSNFEFSIGTPF